MMIALLGSVTRLYSKPLACAARQREQAEYASKE